MKFLLLTIMTLGSLSAFAEGSDYISPVTGNTYKNVSVIVSKANSFGLGDEIGSDTETEKCNEAVSQMVQSIQIQGGIVLEASCGLFDGLAGRKMVIVTTK